MSHATMKLPFEVEFYPKVLQTWPTSGKVILGTFNEDSVLLYQAYNPSIAKWAVEHQTFVGCPDYKMDRMTWVKTNFLWMMYRSGWATKVNQENILGIRITREGFKEILGQASKKRGEKKEEDQVRLQWDPDHDPHGNKMERRAIQIGLRGDILHKLLNEWILNIYDVTEYVQEQYKCVMDNNLDALKVPFEKIYAFKDERIRLIVGADESCH